MKPMLCKVLAGDVSPHVGTDIAWSLPTRNKDGSWKPGAWRREDLPDNACTTEPAQCSAAGSTVYVAEARGATHIGTALGLVLARSVRLLRPLTEAELFERRIVLGSGDGSTVKPTEPGTWWIGGDAHVYTHAPGMRLVVYDRARVKVHGNVVVRAHDRTSISAFNDCRVIAQHNAYVRAYNDAIVHASGDARIDADDDVYVRASGRSRIVANGFVNVCASERADVQLFGNTTARAQGEVHVAAFDETYVSARDNAAVELHDDAMAHVSGDVKVQASQRAIVNVRRTPSALRVKAQHKSIVHIDHDSIRAVCTLQDDAVLVDDACNPQRVVKTCAASALSAP